MRDSSTTNHDLHERLYRDQIARRRRGEQIPVEAYVQRHPELHENDEAVLELILGEVLLRREQGEPVTVDEFVWRFPHLESQLREHFSLHQILAAAPEAEPSAADMPPEPPPAALLLPGYDIISELGRGSSGVVYKAAQRSLQRHVALKVLSHGVAWQEGRNRFETEAQALAQLQHPNIVQIHDVGVHDDLPYLVCELVPGGNLAERLTHGPLPPKTAAQLVAVTAETIHFAHTRGILHRDLKPANILLDDNDDTSTPHPRAENLKITDFGLAKLMNQSSGQTHTGQVVGTPAYMAPEQAGRRDLPIGPAADVYALGAILYESLTGRPPFLGESALDTLLAVTNDEPIPPQRLRPGVPNDLATICLKCLAKEPRHRYTTAQDLADDLHRWLNGEPIHARPAPPWERLLRWARRHPALAALSLLCLIFAASAVITLIVSNVSLSVQRDQVTQALGQEQQARRDLAAVLHRETKLLYLDRVRLAERLWNVNQVAPAVRLLDLCPPQHRGWEWHYMDARRRANERTLNGHPDGVMCVAFRPDGRVFATADFYGHVTMWDADLYKKRASFVAHKDVVRHLVFSPDGKFLATASPNAVRIWEATSRKRLWHLHGHDWLAFHPDGGTIATSVGNNVLVYSIADGRTVHTLKGHTGTVHCGVFHPTSRHLLTAGADERLRTWEVTTGQPVGLPRRCQGVVTAVAYTPDGERLIVSHERGPTALLDAKTGRQLSDLSNASRRKGGLAVSPDGQWLALASSELSVKLHNLHPPYEVVRLPGHSLYPTNAVFRPKGHRLVSVGKDGTIRFWNLSRAREVHNVTIPPFHVTAMALHPDGHQLAVALHDPQTTATETQHVRILDLTGQELRRFPGMHAVAYNQDGSCLATIRRDGVCAAYDSVSGNKRNTFAISGGCHKLIISPDGRYLGAAGAAGVVRVWHLQTAAPVGTFATKWKRITTLRFNTDATRLAAAYQTGKIAVWDVTTGQRRHLLSTAPGPKAVTFSPDGRHLFVAGWNPVIDMYDQTTGQRIRRFHGHTRTITGLAFLPDGSRLISAARDFSVRLWHVETGREVLSLPGLEWLVGDVVVSRDGRHIMASDKGVKWWRSSRRDNLSH